MNICFSLSSLTYGGAERVAVSLCNYFCKHGHSVSIVLVSVDYNNTFYDLDESIKVYPLLRTNMSRNPFVRVRALRKLILNLNPDVVISFLPFVSIYTHYALRKTNIPHICSERNDPKQHKWYLKPILRHVFKKSSGCVFQTLDELNFYKNGKNKRIILPNPVFLNLSSDAKRKNKKNNVFISVGRLCKQKNFEFLINVFNVFLKTHPNFKLVIYGEGPLRPQLENLVCKLSLNDKVFLPGTNPNWHDDAINCSGFISTSNYEGMPNCLEEALCLGCPAIATDCPAGGSRELVEMLNSGMLIEMNNEKQLLSAFEVLANNQNKNEIPDYSMLKIDTIANRWLEFLGFVIHT